MRSKLLFVFGIGGGGDDGGGDSGDGGGDCLLLYLIHVQNAFLT